MASSTEKRSHTKAQDILSGVKIILLDVEGTSTPLSFIKETLPTCVRDNVKSFLESHWDKDECKQDIKELTKQAKKDKEAKVEGVIEIPVGGDNEDDKDAVMEAVVKNVLWQMDSKRSSDALRSLQKHIWRDAYKTNKCKAQVYSDLVDAMKKWKDTKKVYTFSSTSSDAQKVMFSNTESGDLSEQFSGHFDSAMGSKEDKETYTKIAEETDVKPEEVAFFTDLPSEAKCASDAGMRTCLVERKGNTKLTDEDKSTYNNVSSFADVGEKPEEGEPPAKK